MNQYLETYREHQHVDASPELERCIRFLLQKNILCGDALTMLQNNGEPITFCEWTFIGTNGKVKRRDFEPVGTASQRRVRQAKAWRGGPAIC